MAYIPALCSWLKINDLSPSSVLTAGLLLLWKCKCSLSLNKHSRWRPLTMPCSSIYKYWSLLSKACVGISVITFKYTMLIRVQALRARRIVTDFLSFIHPFILPGKKGQLRDQLSSYHVCRHCDKHLVSKTLATSPLGSLQWELEAECACLSVCFSRDFQVERDG